MKLSRVLNRLGAGVHTHVTLSRAYLRRYGKKALANEQEIIDLKNLLSMFTVEDLRGTFNHYMEMQKQAIHGQSGEFTVNFWKEQAGKQLKIIEAFENLTA